MKLTPCDLVCWRFVESSTTGAICLLLTVGSPAGRAEDSPGNDSSTDHPDLEDVQNNRISALQGIKIIGLQTVYGPESTTTLLKNVSNR